MTLIRYSLDDALNDMKAVSPEFARQWDADAANRTIRNAIIGARLAAGLTHAELAARMGASQPMVARIERGQNDVRVSTLQRVADATGIPLTFTILPSGASSLVQASSEETDVFVAPALHQDEGLDNGHALPDDPNMPEGITLDQAQVA